MPNPSRSTRPGSVMGGSSRIWLAQWRLASWRESLSGEILKTFLDRLAITIFRESPSNAKFVRFGLRRTTISPA
jgi:hypothetical protein